MSDRNKIWRIAKPILSALTLVWWSAMLILFVNRQSTGKRFISADFNIVRVGTPISEDYYSVTFKGKKIGYSSVVKQKVPTGFLFHESSFYRLPIGGVFQEITSEGLLSVDESLFTQVLNFSYSAGGYETQVNALARKNMLEVEINTPSGKRYARYPLTGRIFSSTIIPEMIFRRKFTRDTISIPTFDPISLTERSFKVQVLGIDRFKRFGESKVYEVRVFYGGLQSSMFLDTNGTLLMEKTPEGFMMVREEKDIALKMDMRESGATDLLAGFAIPLGGARIENPREAKRMIIKIENLPGELFELDDFNQRWIAESLLLIIDSGGSHDGTANRFGWAPEDTSETFDIQKNDRRILSTAKKITSNATDDSARLSKINEYLFKNIKKGYVSSIPSAVDVLQKMHGDCNEHTVLFVALARSLGIPARTNVGLLYMESDFYYHAWPQAYADGKWMTFDPTLGQSPADATHIKLASGGLDRALVLLRIGDARLKLVSVEYNDGTIIDGNGELITFKRKKE